MRSQFHRKVFTRLTSLMPEKMLTSVMRFRQPVFFLCTLLCLGLPSSLRAQALAPSELMELLNLTPVQIDTLMRRKQFLLLQRESDSASATSYYSAVERNEEGPTWVRSFTYTDAAVGDRQGRMINYRTYDRKEYDEMLSWLLQYNYRTTGQFLFGKDKHTVYSNGKTDIRLKVGIVELPDKRKAWVYEWESGQ